MLDKLFSSPPSDLVSRTRWYIHIRWFFLMSIAIPGLLSLYIGEGLSVQFKRDAILSMIAIASNAVFYGLSLRTTSTRYYRSLASVLIVVDILLATYLIYTKGGVESRSPILYVIPILMSAAIFGRIAIYRTALAAVGLYSGLIILDYLNIIHTIGAVNPGLRTQSPYVINTIAFFASVLLVIAAVADYLTRMLIDKQRQASASAVALQRAQSIARLGSWELDVSTGRMQVSDELLRIFDIKKGSFDFETFIKRIHPKDRPVLCTHLANARDKLLPFSFDHRLLMPDRTSRFIHTEGQIIKDKKGRAVKVIGTDQDITAEKALDSAKDEFVSLASHQLRTPATGVRTYLSMILDGYVGKIPPKQREFIDQAFRANERQLHIIDGLLSVASIESGKITLDKVPTDLGELISNSIHDNDAAFQGRKQSIILDQPAKPVIVDIDRHRFRMILDNLLSNASKYTPEGGAISVKLLRQNGKALISVTDTGIGIPKKDLTKLFVKFSRLNNTSGTDVEGSGLGLYLTKYLVGLHGGTISVSSKPGRGSVFSVRLPLRMRRSAAKSSTNKKPGEKLRRLASIHYGARHRKT